MGDIIGEASVDDLEWFLQMLELQLEETPHWVTDPVQLHEAQAWTRRVRTMTTEILHSKHVAGRSPAWWKKAGQRLIWLVLSALLGAAAATLFT